MQVYIKTVPLKKTGNQDLSAAKMDVSTAFGKKWQLTGVYIHFDAACSQTVTVKRDSSDGANYDSVIKSEVLSSATDFSWSPTEEILESGDEINVQVSKGGTANGYLTIVGKEL